jgi:hypothetical protein
MRYVHRALVVGLLVAAPAAWAQDFRVDFDNGQGASSFTTSKLINPAINYAYDYSTYSYYKAAGPGFPFAQIGPIPSAPRSVGNTTIGLRMAARTLTTDANGWVSAVANRNVTGPYRMTFDMWVNYNGGQDGGDGSTEFVFAGLSNTGDGYLKNVSAFAGSATAASEGYALAVDGEGGTTSDYRIYYTDPTDDGPTYDKINATWAAPAGSPAPDSAGNPYYSSQGLFGANETPGAPGKSWVTVVIEQPDARHVNWSFNGKLIASLTLAEDADGIGKPFLNYSDIIASGGIPGGAGQAPGDSLADSFVIFDNVLVEAIPEPGMGLLGVAIGGAFVTRRRRARR